MKKINLLSNVIGALVSVIIFLHMKDGIKNQIINLSGEIFIFEKMMLFQITLIIICANIIKYSIKKYAKNKF